MRAKRDCASSRWKISERKLAELPRSDFGSGSARPPSRPRARSGFGPCRQDIARIKDFEDASWVKPAGESLRAPARRLKG